MADDPNVAPLDERRPEPLISTPADQGGTTPSAGISDVTPPAAASEPAPAETRSETKPSFLDKLLRRGEGTREPQAAAQDGEPEAWRPPQTKEEFDRALQAETDRREMQRAQRERVSTLARLDSEMDTAEAQGDDLKVAEIARQRRAIERDDRERASSGQELDRFAQDLVSRHDSQSLDVWLEQLPGLDPAELKGDRASAARKLFDAAKEQGAVDLLDELRSGKSETAQAIRKELIAAFNLVGGADNTPVQVAGSPAAATPDRTTLENDSAPIEARKAAWGRLYPGVEWPGR